MITWLNKRNNLKIVIILLLFFVPWMLANYFDSIVPQEPRQEDIAFYDITPCNVSVFEFFPNNSKIAILYPQNTYGYSINNIVDKIADQSNSIIVNRASYKDDMTNVREAIKELGKYELRKYELNRQKKILALKKDNQSKKRLQKLTYFA